MYKNYLGIKVSEFLLNLLYIDNRVYPNTETVRNVKNNERTEIIISKAGVLAAPVSTEAIGRKTVLLKESLYTASSQ